MSPYTPGPQGRIDVVVELASGHPALQKSAISKSLNAFISKTPYGNGSIHNLVCGAERITFSVIGPCSFDLLQIEDIIRNMGGVIKKSDASVVKPK